MENAINFYKRCTYGKLQDEYSPLQNLMIDDVLHGFQTSKLIYDFCSPIEIDCQLSYDDSINLILNNNAESPKLINTTFAKLENNTYEYIVRNQKSATNIYDERTITNETDLFIRSIEWPIIDLLSVTEGGNLWGGNYIFYLKYCDEDGNESDIMSESSCVTIAHGDSANSSHGTLLDERTSKQINLSISNLDIAYTSFVLYFTRETSDLNGFNITKCYKIEKPFIMENSRINITGNEIINEISIDELNIQYNYYTEAKTQAVVQNMLFLGNVKSTARHNQKLQQLSYRIKVLCKQKSYSIGYVNSNYNNSANKEYYDPLNVYYYLGYWPDEYYKLGVVYLLEDGTTTSAFSLLGCIFNDLNTSNINVWTNNNNKDFIESDNVLETNKILNSVINTGGIFKTPSADIINFDTKDVKPLHFQIEMPEYIQTKLKDLGVVGYFFVRQKRNPTSLFQGLSVGIDKNSGFLVPFIRNGYDNYYYESLINGSKELSDFLPDKLTKNINIKYHALLSLDPIVDPNLQSNLLWNDYNLISNYTGICHNLADANKRHYTYSINGNHESNLKRKLIYINDGVPSFFIDKFYFSTKAGNAESVFDMKFMTADILNGDLNQNIIRGESCPIIGIGSDSDEDRDIEGSTLYTVKLVFEHDLWMQKLLNDQSEYYTISNRYKLSDTDTTIDVYRGDCFTNTVTMRLTKNFVDPTFPTNDVILDKNTLKKNFKGLSNSETDWDLINVGDLNATPIGIWITYKCLSNYNLGLRAIDRQNTTYIEKLGSYGMFYPISGISTKSTNKTPESKLLNGGYSVILGRKIYPGWQSVPYENYHFENRIAFSNISSTKMFTNGFRVFQGLSYQDVDKQFGTITKLMPYGQNLLCVFEHGLAIVPINEKALLSTQEGMSIHLYGAGVLQEQVSVISPDYGSTWMDSIIKTPNAYYGVDTHARKIWKYNNVDGFTCISDFKIQSYLNDNLYFDDLDSYFTGVNNVKTHFNNFKGDVIFTFYKDNTYHSLCYNELLGKWISRQSWQPLLSANVDNNFYSFSMNDVNHNLNLYHNNQTSEISCKQIYHENIPISLNYSHQLYDADLQVTKVKINNQEFKPVPYKRVIDENDKFIGWYFEGINNSLDTENNIKLWINENINDSSIDIRPENTFVYINKSTGERYITPEKVVVEYGEDKIQKEFVWLLNRESTDEKWWYIECTINFDEDTDSDGNEWLRAKITRNEWSPIIEETYNSISKPMLIVMSDDYEEYHHQPYYFNYTGKWADLNGTELEVNWKIVEDKDNSIFNVIPIEYGYRVFCIYIQNTHENKINTYTLQIDSITGYTDNLEFELYVDAFKNTINLVKDNKLIFIPNRDTEMKLWKHDINASITNWYGKQEPFELEFIVNQPSGIHKIFNNLVIISNNVEPNSLEVEILGDVFNFPKEAILNDSSIYSFPEIFVCENKKYYTTIKKDRVTQEYSLLTHQDCLNINNFGRRLGNISYIEGKWHLVLQPIYYNHKDDKDNKILKTTRLRDKWAKIRIKYSGEKLAIITAIQTLTNISYV